MSVERLEDAGADDAADAEGHQSECAEFVAVCGVLFLRCHAPSFGGCWVYDSKFEGGKQMCDDIVLI